MCSACTWIKRRLSKWWDQFLEACCWLFSSCTPTTSIVLCQIVHGVPRDVSIQIDESITQAPLVIHCHMRNIDKADTLVRKLCRGFASQFLCHRVLLWIFSFANYERIVHTTRPIFSMAEGLCLGERYAIDRIARTWHGFLLRRKVKFPTKMIR